MTIINEKTHPGEWMVSMPECQRWVTTAVIKSGESRVLLGGNIMMKGANPGEFTEWAKAVDGSADPVGILFSANVDATTADVKGVIIADDDVQANRAELNYPAGATAAEILYADTVLARDRGIKVRESCS